MEPVVGSFFHLRNTHTTLGDTMKILVINAGSSSIKFQVFDMDTEKVLGKGDRKSVV